MKISNTRKDNLARKFKRAAIGIALSSVATTAAADWELDAENTSLHFLSTKNAQVTEVHQFTSLSGSVSDSGELTVDVDLSSVDTGIDIRNTRMKEMLFNVTEFGSATFEASIPKAMLSGKAGDVQLGAVDGILSLHGMAAPMTFHIAVSLVDKSTISVSTTQPSLLDVSAFGLTDGVESLREVAGLKSITTTVPVTFTATFTK